MAWITSIDLQNFRGITRMAHPIAIPPFHHVMIYGENGSGKTSIFQALDYIFRTSIDPSVLPIQRNHFVDPAEPAFVKITVSNAIGATSPVELQVGDDLAAVSNQVSLLQEASKVRGFLDYKKILVAHAVGLDNGTHLNVFGLLVKVLLADHPITLGASSTTVGLLDEYSRVSDILLNRRKGSAAHTIALQDLADWNAAFKALLMETARVANGYLERYFHHKLKVDFRIADAEAIERGSGNKREMREEIFFKIFFAEKEVPNYHIFLNEARLSAFSICLFLASIKTYPIQAAELRLIYLDDVFIGMDNGNRMPLLEILKDNFLKQNEADQQFQLFLSTYDRHWFELARSSFSGEGFPIHSIEMFVDDNGDPSSPDEAIILPAEGNVKKARAHFQNKDYVIAAHLLRKECERLLKAYLPHEFQVSNDGSYVKELEGLLSSLHNYLDQYNITVPNLIAKIRTFRTSVLNPSSHSDLESPIFRQEIAAVFDLVDALENLPNIERELRIPVKSEFMINIPTLGYKMILVSANSICKVMVDSVSVPQKFHFFISTWSWGGVEFGVSKAGAIERAPEHSIERSITEKRELANIIEGIEKQIGTIGIDPLELLVMTDGNSLKRLLA